MPHGGPHVNFNSNFSLYNACLCKLGFAVLGGDDLKIMILLSHSATHTFWLPLFFSAFLSVVYWMLWCKSSVKRTHILRSTNLEEWNFYYQRSRSWKLASVTDLKALARDCQTMKGRSFKLFASTAKELNREQHKHNFMYWLNKNLAVLLLKVVDKKLTPRSMNLPDRLPKETTLKFTALNTILNGYFRKNCYLYTYNAHISFIFVWTASRHHFE